MESSTQKEVEEVDIKTGKIINMYGGLHLRTDVHRLYLIRQMGRRGLKEVKATIDAEKQWLDEYVQKKKDLEPLIQTVWEQKV